MIRIENECVGCPPEMGCLGSSCPHVNVKVMYCDNCECEADMLYVVDEKQLCEDCLLSNFPTITPEDLEEF